MIKRLYYILLQRFYVFRKKNQPCQGKVFMFHKIDDENGLYSITPEHFRSLIETLMKNKKIVDIDTLVREKDPDNVTITFDDVYESVYRNAYPVLKEKGIPYYLFVCNEFLDRERYLSSEMIEEMLKESKAILGSHDMRHLPARMRDPETVRQEMSGSKEELEKKFKIKIDSFAFPYGSMYACSDENISDASKISDYVFMTYPLSYHETMGKVLPRININDQTYEKECR